MTAPFPYDSFAPSLRRRVAGALGGGLLLAGTVTALAKAPADPAVATAPRAAATPTVAEAPGVARVSAGPANAGRPFVAQGPAPQRAAAAQDAPPGGTDKASESPDAVVLGLSGLAVLVFLALRHRSA